MANRGVFAAIVLAVACGGVHAQQGADCASLKRLIASTYDFLPSKLTAEQLTEKSKEMDRVWSMVTDHRETLLPCLRAALEATRADVMFRFDGSTLLVKLDPSRDNKALQVKCFTGVPFGNVDSHLWISVLSQLGLEGHDVSEAASRWLEWPEASYYIPAHGMYEYKQEEGGLFLLGSMDEAVATPALVRIIETPKHGGREAAVRLLTSQATHEALKTLAHLDTKGFGPRTVAMLKGLREGSGLLAPSTTPRLSRDEVVRTIDDLAKPESKNWSRFEDVILDQPADVLAVLTEEDLPKLRLVRRRVAAGGTFHWMERYNTLSAILWAKVWSADLVK